MINYEVDLLDRLDQNEFWLAQHIARHLSTRTGAAIPGAKKLLSLTGWSCVKKLRRVRDSLVEKKVLAYAPRFNDNGKQTSHEYRFIGGCIKIFLGVDQLQELYEEIAFLKDQLAGKIDSVPAPAKEESKPGKGGKKVTPTPGKNPTPRGGKKITPKLDVLLTTCPTNFNIPNGFGDDFLEVFKILLGEKKWKNKSLKAVNMSLKKLGRYPEAFAIELVENAISGGYQGVVFPSTPEAFERWEKNKNLQNGTTKGNTGNGFDAGLSHAFARTIERINAQGQAAREAETNT